MSAWIGHQPSSANTDSICYSRLSASLGQDACCRTETTRNEPFRISDATNRTVLYIKWHLDEVFMTTHGRRYYLWRVVDSKGHVIDILMQPRRNAKVAKRFFEAALGKTDIFISPQLDKASRMR